MRPIWHSLGQTIQSPACLFGPLGDDAQHVSDVITHGICASACFTRGNRNQILVAARCLCTTHVTSAVFDLRGEVSACQSSWLQVGGVGFMQKRNDALVDASKLAEAMARTPQGKNK